MTQIILLALIQSLKDFRTNDSQMFFEFSFLMITCFSTGGLSMCCLGNRPYRKEQYLKQAQQHSSRNSCFCLLGQNCHVTTVAIRKIFLPNQYLFPRKGEWILSRQQASVTAYFRLVSHLQSFHIGRSFLSSLFTHQSVLLSHFSFKHIV